MAAKRRAEQFCYVADSDYKVEWTNRRKTVHFSSAPELALTGAGTDRSRVFSAGAGAEMLVNSGCYFLKKELVAFQTFFTKLADTSRFEVSHISACPNFDFLQDFLKLSMFVMIF